MDRKLNIVIMGGGGILDQHAPGFERMSDFCEVKAVAEPDESRHERIRSLLKNPKLPIYENYEKLYELEDIDAVDIILPHHLHMDATIKAAQKGWHVLTEKVMARNTWECDRMIEACNAAGVRLVVCHDRRYAGHWVALKKVIESGVLGRILFWKLEHNQDVIFPPNAWVRHKDMIGGGAIMSCLTHQIDALRWMGGEIEQVNCMTVTEPGRMEGECIGLIGAQMQSGSIAQLSINWYTQSNGPPGFPLWYEFIHVTGTEGEAYFMAGFENGTFVKPRTPREKDETYSNDNVSFTFKAGEQGFFKVDHKHIDSGHVKCIEEFVKAARGEEALILTPGSDTVKTVEVAEAAYIAQVKNCNVSLPLKDRVRWEDRPY
ncbi:MAG: Gfo/Idh/MocA family oxidoreductase [Clostridiales bacterium]|nr:Gfo/Idh/MocA family oxidoreductase [Clostridiales bacterium]